MDDKKALEMLTQILDQCSANGMFKTLETANQVQQMYLHIKKHLSTPPAKTIPEGSGHL